MSDRLELAEYRSLDSDLQVPLYFRVAGPSYADDPRALKAEVGQAVRLVPDPGNVHDPHAVLIIYHGDVKLGFVPRQYSELISTHLNRGRKLDATITGRVLVPGEEHPHRWVIQVVAI